VNLEEMIELDSPTVFYVNRSERVSCKVSTIHFGYGTVVRSSDEMNPLITDDQKGYKTNSRIIFWHDVRIINSFEYCLDFRR
jgi:hypothetical protein